MQLKSCSVPFNRAVRAPFPGLDLGADPAQDRQPGDPEGGKAPFELSSLWPHIFPPNKTSVEP